MKISAIIISRNDNYGGYLAERSTYAINSAIATYDEVFYIDWNSETHSLLYNIKNDLQLKGNINFGTGWGGEQDSYADLTLIPKTTKKGGQVNPNQRPNAPKP